MTSLRLFRSGGAAATGSQKMLWASEAGVVVALAAAFALRRWDQIGPYPTGLDAGNWLAFGRGMFGDGKSTEGAYPPLVPFLAELCRVGGHAFDLLKGLAVASLLVPAAAMFAVTRPFLRPWFALPAAVIVAFARPFGEAAAFGGYPQNFALAFGLVSVVCAIVYARSGRRTPLLTAAVAMALAALAHHMYFVASMLWLAATLAAWAVLDRRGGFASIRPRLPLLAIPAAGAIAFLPTWLLIEQAGYSPPFNAGDASRWDSWKYATGGHALPWAVVLAASVAGLAASRSSERLRPLFLVGTTAMAVGITGFLVTGEGRLLALTFCGIALGVAVGLDAMRSRLAGSVLVGLPQGLVFSLVLLLPIADKQARDDFNYYRTIEPGAIGAARWLDRNAHGEAVVVGANSRGWPVGWWFEGLTGDARIVVGSDLRWVAFPAERDSARTAASFFVPGISLARVRELAAGAGVRYLVFSVRDWTGWEDWEEQPSTVYHSPTYRIIDIDASAPAR